MKKSTRELFWQLVEAAALVYEIYQTREKRNQNALPEKEKTMK